MPTRFFSVVRWSGSSLCPETIEAADLARHFWLDGEDLEFVRRQPNGAGQLGIALQLCALRWLGFIPDDLPSAPAEAVAALAGVLDAPPGRSSITRSGPRPGASIARSRYDALRTCRFVPGVARATSRRQIQGAISGCSPMRRLPSVTMMG